MLFCARIACVFLKEQVRTSAQGARSFSGQACAGAEPWARTARAGGVRGCRRSVSAGVRREARDVRFVLARREQLARGQAEANALDLAFQLGL